MASMREKGFTIPELLVVVSIIVLMTALILPNWRSGERSLALERSSHKLGQDIRRAQEFAMRAQAFTQCPVNTKITGYGIVFDTGWSLTQYRLFANCKPDAGADDFGFDGNDVVLEDETISLESGVEIASVSPSAQTSIVFIPPTPRIYINGETGGPDAQVVLQRVDSATTIRTITVTSKGIIDVD